MGCLTCIKFLFDVFISHVKFGKAWNCRFSSQCFSTKAFCYSSPPTSARGFKFLLGLQRSENVWDFNCIWNTNSMRSKIKILFWSIQWYSQLVFRFIDYKLMFYFIICSLRRKGENNETLWDGEKPLLLCSSLAELWNLNNAKGEK